MSHTFSQPIYSRRIHKVMWLIRIMSKHADVATRETPNKWRLTWHADRVDVAFDDELDWAFFKENFSDRCLVDLAYRGLVPNAEMVLDRRRGAKAAQEVLEQIPAYLRQRR
ncbi:hypothetical protein ACRAWG_35620 [Methylobacterium sp. P31]